MSFHNVQLLISKDVLTGVSQAVKNVALIKPQDLIQAFENPHLKLNPIFLTLGNQIIQQNVPIHH
jgi:hypothetical protein